MTHRLPDLLALRVPVRCLDVGALGMVPTNGTRFPTQQDKVSRRDRDGIHQAKLGVGNPCTGTTAARVFDQGHSGMAGILAEGRAVEFLFKKELHLRFRPVLRRVDLE